MARRSPARRARPRRRRPRGAGSARDRSRPGRARAHAIGAARPARRRAARGARAGAGARRAVGADPELGDRPERRGAGDRGRRPAGGRRTGGAGNRQVAGGDAAAQVGRPRPGSRRGASDRAGAGEVIDVLDLPGARAAFSTRHGGVSQGPYESLNLGLLTEDEPDRVRENRARLAHEAKVDPERVVMGWQVHGADVQEWDGPPEGELPRVDGHLTGEAGLAMLVLVADCYPVARSDGTRAAMLHCGWRPLAGGLIDRAVARFETPPAAAVGPGIGGCCYEVGPEVAERFADVDGA